MKVLVLLNESLVPPENNMSRKEWLVSPVKTEYDVVQSLKRLGHEVQICPVGGELGIIRKMAFEFRPHIVFNLLEEFAGEAIFDHNIVSYLEMLKLKYTGCNPRGLMLARDKGISKKILKFHRISTPDFFVFRKGLPLKNLKKIKYPMFVKTLNEEASLGITQGSIVNNEAALIEKVQQLQEKYDTDAIAETYIDGREFYVGVIGNSRTQVLPIWELFFDKASDSVPRIATSKVKWDFEYRKKLGIRTGPTKNLDESLRKDILSLCKRAFKALELNGYARMDLRMNREGKIFIIEANPNPDIGDEEDLAGSAHHVDLTYDDLISKILNLGLKWQPY